ncbi:MAG: 3-hydroxyacyl-ACP dehydratase FabZ [Psychrilyobacter sp.]|nr:3-hydroxyacyl-ACP dehydratase FabZ [Psychrilyobacter sp.]
MMRIEEIKKKLPHRYPFLLVDRVTEITETTLTAYKNVSVNEEFFNGHFPGHPIMPGVLIVEGMAQALGLLVSSEDESEIPLFASIESAKFKAPVVPGDQLVYEVEVLKARKTIVKGSAVAKVDGKIVATATIMFAIIKK